MKPSSLFFFIIQKLILKSMVALQSENQYFTIGFPMEFISKSFKHACAAAFKHTAACIDMPCLCVVEDLQMYSQYILSFQYD